MKGRKLSQWWMAAVGLVVLFGAAYGVSAQVEAPAAPLAPPAPKAGVMVVGQGAWLGVGIREVTPEQAEELQLGSPHGALVTEVRENSPAAEAGLEENDVIVEFDGVRVRSARQLRRLVRETPPNRAVGLEVVRSGQRHNVQAKLGQRHARARVRALSALPRVRMLARRPRLGITGQALTRQLAAYFGVEQGEGVLVAEVLGGSAAAKAGLQAGDVIVAVDGDSVGSVRELRQELAAQKSNSRVTLTVVRDREPREITVELVEPEPRSPRSTAELHLMVDPEQWERMGEEVQVQAEALEREVQESLRALERELEPQLKELERELERKMWELEKEMKTLGRTV